MRPLDGRTAIVTGAGGGIGAATGRRLSADGARVGLADLRPEMVQELAREIGGVPLAIDVTSVDSVRRVFDDFVAETGRLDVLVNCAGIVDTTPVDDISPEAWSRVFDVNTRGTFLCCQAALRHMREGASIINVGSRAALVGGTTSGASYAASKAAVVCLTKSLAKHAAGAGVRVNVINPGCIETQMLDNFPEDVQQAMVGQSVFGRLGAPDEIGSVVSFLASGDSSFMTGAALNVNGGSHM
jgi:3-oxoacyl-[acyl-carrier protein] reductase